MSPVEPGEGVEREHDSTPARSLHDNASPEQGNAPHTEGEGEADVSKEGVGKRGRPRFTREQAAEAGRLSAQKRRERKAERTREAELAGLTARQRLGIAISKLTQAQLDAVIQRLATDAAAGDTKAVHALARVLDQSFGRAQEAAPEDGRDADEKDWQEMTPGERAAYRAALIEQVERERAERGPALDSSDPRG